ncbi:N-acetylglucosamine kinase [Marivirga arenosa]|uniref:N-acetylglucosamine kinase n=1 Tax=Marivirga arenosa TaxID=3059076 RepID=A0AA49GI91_9BACT|nr:BadF/BadG/BcrA/BcrD ATPase family protein [Marivirga sp. ABR2-2]WKK86029.2 N-acetylglucosamine kinase [Marivirga sp. ABR2-2]
MRQLIVDSGSSKTDWRIINEDGSIQQLKTKGINPYLIPGNELLDSLKNELSEIVKIEFDIIHFYGAGCGQSKNKAKIKSVLNSIFNNSKVLVEDDMLAAARASCLDQSGIVCILGTGANACFYDGKSITQKMISLGYALGDEGSGNYIGKRILKAYLENDLSEKLQTAFKNTFPEVTLENALENIYQKPYANRYFAQFFEFVILQQKEKYCFELMTDAFQQFLEKSVLKFDHHQEYPIHFVGSVAFHANSIIRMVLNKNHLTAGNFMESPIAGLTLYHKNQNS